MSDIIQSTRWTPGLSGKTEIQLSSCGRFEARLDPDGQYYRLHLKGDPSASLGEAPSLAALSMIADCL